MKNKASKTHVYCMPGMCAKPTIFKNLKLPEEQFKIHWLDWIMPKKDESLESYARRLCEDIHHTDIVLIGVSLGGVVIQEMQKFVSVKKLVLVSTVKSKYELPTYMKLTRKSGLYRILPAGSLRHFKKMENWPIFSKAFRKRLKVYNQYLGMDDAQYVRWAIRKILFWDRKEPLPGLIQIQGDEDRVFPIKYIEDCHVVEGATHLLIINRFKWLNENLPRLIAGESRKPEIIV